jgi:hypothetical protein
MCGPPPAPADGSSGRGRHVTRTTLGAMVRIPATIRRGLTSVTSSRQTPLRQ